MPLARNLGPSGAKIELDQRSNYATRGERPWLETLAPQGQESSWINARTTRPRANPPGSRARPFRGKKELDQRSIHATRGERPWLETLAPPGQESSWINAQKRKRDRACRYAVFGLVTIRGSWKTCSALPGSKASSALARFSSRIDASCRSSSSVGTYVFRYGTRWPKRSV
jgi:hypothetical protein